MSETSSPKQFLREELAYAERHLARLRRIAAAMEDDLATQGLSEAQVFEKLSANKAYRQLFRDQAVFQQMWIRCQRFLLRFAAEPAPPREPDLAPIDVAALHRHADSAKPQPYRKPFTPGPNQPCLCGSALKYKKCCGNPLREHPKAA